MASNNSALLKQRMHKMLPHLILCMLPILFGLAHADDELPLRIDGDIGIGGYYTHSIIHNSTNHVTVLPYGNFDYGWISLRIDTLSFKTIRLGYGYLEIAGRYSQDGFNADSNNLHGLANRQSSVPLGLGTLQVTPVGAFLINAFHDINQSGGNLFEAIYFAKAGSLPVTFYPFAGIEYQSAKYVRYYYGVSAAEAAASQFLGYQPTGAYNPLLGLMTDVRLTKEYHLAFYLRRKWQGNTIHSSPIVGKAMLDNGFVALSYRFE